MEVRQEGIYWIRTTKKQDWFPAVYQKLRLNGIGMDYVFREINADHNDYTSFFIESDIVSVSEKVLPPC